MFSNPKGGNCPADIDNFYSLIKELRAQAGSKIWISIAGQAAPQNFQFYRLKELSDLIDMWHIMTYDYTVSDTPTSNATAPNCPLYNPLIDGAAAFWSVNSTVYVKNLKRNSF